MNSKSFLCFLAFFVLALSTVNSLNCIQCNQYVNNTDDSTSREGDCKSKKDGPGILCEKGEVCSTIYDNKSSMLTRGCDKDDICVNINITQQSCSTCSTDLCGSSDGYQINPISTSIIAGLLFALLGR